MKPLAGTWVLIRLALRRDRIKLPLWIIGIAGMMAANVPAVMDFYGGTAQQLTYASTTATSVVSRIFGGPINGPNIGEIVVNETFLFTAVAIAFMSTLAITRHTRQNEETGRAELIRSAVVGTQASLTAALTVTVGANVILAILLSLVLIGAGLPVAGSVIVGAGLGLIGVIFSAIAAIAAQLSESARGANNLSAIAIGCAFLLRAIGDGLGHVVNGGMAVASSWASWLSPIGWGQQLYAFTESNTWIFGLFAGLFTALLLAAYSLSAHRDVGLGILPARRGPARAASSLLSPFGLAWRLQRGTIRGWAVAIFIMGVTIGAISKEFEKLFTDNEQFAEFLGQSGFSGSFADILFSGMMVFMTLAIAAYALQALLKMRAEESSSHLEPILAARVSRPGWMFSHIACALIGVVSLVLLLGLSASISYVLITGNPWSDVGRLTLAAVIHIPAICVMASISIFIFGLLPRSVTAISWITFAVCFFIIQFGAVLKLPNWLINVSPFGHTPAAPIEQITAIPLLTLLVIAGLLAISGIFLFRQRDITTE